MELFNSLATDPDNLLVRDTPGNTVALLLHMLILSYEKFKSCSKYRFNQCTLDQLNQPHFYQNIGDFHKS